MSGPKIFHFNHPASQACFATAIEMMAKGKIVTKGRFLTAGELIEIQLA